VDKNLGLAVEENGLVHDLVAALRLPDAISLQSNLANLLYNQSEQSDFTPQIISTLSKLLFYPPSPGKNIQVRLQEHTLI
jgi:hypothetical protein